MKAQERSDKKRRIVLRLVLAAIVAGALWMAFLRWSMPRRLAAKMAVLESRGYPVTLEQLDGWYRLPEGAENAADHYMEAFDWRVVWDEDATQALPLVGFVSLPAWNARLDPNTVSLMQAYLADNKETLLRLDRGARCEHARYPVVYRGEDWGRMPWLADVRHCAQLYAMKMLLAIEQSDPDGYVTSFSNGMALVGSLGQIPNLNSQLVCVACSGLLQGVLEHGLGRLDLAESHLVQLSDDLGSGMEVDHLIRATAGGTCVILHSLLHAQMADERGVQPADLLFWLYRSAGLMHRDLCEYLELSQSMLHPRPTSVQSLLNAARQAETKVQAVPKSHLVIKRTSPAHSNVFRVFRRYYAGLLSAQTSVAALQYALKYRGLPESLERMVPEFMQDVPLDPFDGEQIRYVKQENGFTVCSVGQDRQDNGGRGRDPKARSKPYDQAFSVRKGDGVD